VKFRKTFPYESVREADPTAPESGTETDLPIPRGPAETFEQVYTQFVGPIYRFFYTRVGNREDAEDLTSQTFLKAARQLDPGRPEATVASWLFTVARTVLADHWRTYYRHGAMLPVDDLHVDLVAGTETLAVEGSETEHRVAGILAALPTRYRRVLEFRVLRGYSVAETAQELGVAPGNVKVIQHRALAKAAQVNSAPSLQLANQLREA